jgi:integrase
MPQRAKSGTKGLHKNHTRGCSNTAGKPTSCDCPWYGKYKGIFQSLAKWSGKAVDPREKKPAQKVLTRFRAAIDNKTYRPEGEQYSGGSEASLNDYIKEWKTHYAEEQSLHMASIDSRLKPVQEKLGKCSLKYLAESPAEIERFMNALAKERDWSNNSWNRLYELLHSMFERALKWKTGGVPRMPVNPMVFIEKRVGTRKKFDVRLEEDVEARLFAACDWLDDPAQLRPKKLTAEKAQQIREAVATGTTQAATAALFGVSRTVVCQIIRGQIWNADNYRSTTRGDEMRLRLMAGFDLGVRKQEMLDVQLKHVDPRPLAIVVDGQKQEVIKITLEPRMTKGGKTTGELEYVYAASERLKAALVRRRFELQRDPDAYVFGKKDGRRAVDFTKAARRLFALAGLEWGRDKGVVWHTTRHEFSSRAVENTDGDLMVARELTRHKDLKTLEGYLHARKGRVLSAAVRMGRRSS